MDEHVKNLLSFYIDNELSPNDQVKCKNHLKECDECREDYLYLKKMKEGLAESYEGIQAPEELELTIMEQITSNPIPYEKRISFRVPIGIGAASLLFLMFIMMGWFTTWMKIGTSILTMGITFYHALSLLMASLPYIIEIVGVITVILSVLFTYTLQRVYSTEEY